MMRAKLCLSIVVVILTAALSPAFGQTKESTPPTFLGQTEGDFIIKDFHFKSGEMLPALRLHYATLGTSHRNSSGEIDNAVLLLHSTGSDITEFFEPEFSGPLYGPGQPFDLTKYYLIIPDAIGHGNSSKPSDGLRGHFPHYGYEDIVAAQRRLVTEKFGIGHLRLVMGLSMGGMHTWLWGERYPDMMDGLFPISSLPVETGGRNRLWRHTVVEAIRHDPEWKNGDYEQQPHGFARMVPLIAIMVSNPVRQYEKYPTRAAADAWYERMTEGAYKRADVNDALYHYDASSDYNPAPDLEKIKAKLLLIVFEDDQINSPEFAVLDREMPRVKNGRYVIVPPGKQSNGEGNNTNAGLWRSYLEDLLRTPTNTAVAETPGSPPNQSTAQSSSAEADIRAVMAERLKASFKGDTEKIASSMADDYIQTDISGYVQNKSTWVNEYFKPLAELIKTGKFRWDVFEEKDIQIRIHGDSAVVIGRLELKGNGARPAPQHTWVADPEARPSLTLHFTRVYIRRNEKWLLAALHNAVPAQPSNK
jgi:homoserine O-acetyltransferase